MEERLQKIIARAGVASRRHAEELIASGQVTVNGRMVTEMGSKADAERDHIKVGGKLLRAARERIYLALYKPDGVVSTMSDPEGRKSLADLLRRAPGHVFPIGRLAFHNSGLLLLTNDGELASRLMRSRRMPQTWWLKVKGGLSQEQLVEISRRSGVKIKSIKAGPNAWYEASLRQVTDDVLQPLLKDTGHPVEKMKRVKVGRIELGSMPPGALRPLTPSEIAELRRLAAGGAAPAGGHSETAPKDSFKKKRSSCG